MKASAIAITLLAIVAVVVFIGAFAKPDYRTVGPSGATLFRSKDDPDELSETVANNPVMGVFAEHAQRAPTSGAAAASTAPAAPN